ncbi:type II secretion system F family protein [Phytohalomonas tamaricis]|uniref:type II secretion system F family protein n=1 Tax=Phytohalomonas tamaricis TaxID=2081032 RepID=UPI000D0B3094|nr:type II secretion system F family protein [Phytohalomonas tamaricis]
MATSPVRAKDRHKTRIDTWQWRGKNARGEMVRGELAAADYEHVRRTLAQQSIIVKSIRKQRKLPGFTKRVRPRDITLFARQMATMLRAGIPLLQSFTAVADSTRNPAMRNFIETLHKDVAGGMNFSKALAKHPRHVDELFVHLVEAGEQAGVLDGMLERVATYKEKLDALKARVKKAMYYPTAVLGVGFGVTALLLVKVVPQFESMFKGFGAELPMPTQVTIALSEAAQAHWLQAVIALVAVIFGLRVALKRSPAFSMQVSRLMLRLPILGTILDRSAIARFSRTLATTFAAGVPLMDALETSAGASGNRVYQRAILVIREDVSSGQQLHFAMRNTRLFSALAIQMVAIGEEAGSLDAMLNKVADFYEEDVETRVDTLTSLLEPFIIVVLGILVGGLVVSMYLPIFELGNAI